MKLWFIITIGCFILINFSGLAYGTCVLDSDFGFILNCNFKKSSLFRVRNLGGLKAHFGLGFSVGDELGFGESLGNVEGNKRRSLSQIDNTIGVLPASQMTASPIARPNIQQNNPKALIVQQPQVNIKYMKQLQQSPGPVYKPAAPPAMTEAISLPLGVPAFKPIPKVFTANGQQSSSPSASQLTFNRKTIMYQQPTLNQASSVAQQQLSRLNNQVIRRQAESNVPSFQAMPPQSAMSRISTGPIAQIDNNYSQNIQQIPANKLPEVDLMGHTVEELAQVANVSVEAIQKAIQLKQQQMLIERQTALYKQQLELIAREATSTTTTTTTTTTMAPRIEQTAQYSQNVITKTQYVPSAGHKVMNAPKEYYPVGYEKNFDDNFVTKVDLPPTTFHCGNQKHFPGLYADTDLGCMVFHVCALTDDGLIMKSFLCPESTLFDQTILKCNWWFYVDCKNSKNIYDSNLPVSKSYQLMKALTFFSKYKNSDSEKNSVDIEALRNSVSSSANNNDDDNNIGNGEVS